MPTTSAKTTPARGGNRIDPGIFREYDVRGIAGKNLRKEDARLIARAFAIKAAELSPKPVICIGRDGRKSSPMLADAICRAIVASGARAVDIGVGPTPMLYFAAHTLAAAGGIMITGSHNPPEHNGFKFVLGGQALHGQAIQELRSLAEHGGFPARQGQHEERDVQESYITTLAATYGADLPPLRVVWDAGNGAAGEVMEALGCRLPGEHVMLNANIDGSFPAHHPDPAVAENMKQLVDAVLTQQLDCGIAFDGDGDRIGVVDDEGEIIWGDQLLMLYAAEVLKAKPGSTVIADVKASQALFDEIKRLGGKPLMWKSGHSLIKAKMAETKAPLAGEMSGHMFFADEYFGYDDALYAAVRLLRLLAKSGRKLSVLRKALPKAVNTPEIRIECDDARKFSVIGEVAARLKSAGADFSDIDGVRVSIKEGWWLLRASNTQPMLVARAEGKNEAALKKAMAGLREQLALSKVALLDQEPEA